MMSRDEDDNEWAYKYRYPSAHPCILPALYYPAHKLYITTGQVPLHAFPAAVWSGALTHLFTHPRGEGRRLDPVEATLEWHLYDFGGTHGRHILFPHCTSEMQGGVGGQRVW